MVATFKLPDPYKGMSAAEVKNRCRELVRVVDRWQKIAMTMGVTEPKALKGLPDNDRLRVEGLIESYRD